MADAHNKAMTRQTDNEIGSKPTFMTQRIIPTYIKPLRAGTSLLDARHRTASPPLILARDISKSRRKSCNQLFYIDFTSADAAKRQRFASNTYTESSGQHKVFTMT
jgi:hypothetical protein